MKKLIISLIALSLFISSLTTLARANAAELTPDVISSVGSLSEAQLIELRAYINQLLYAFPIDDTEVLVDTSRKSPARIGQAIELSSAFFNIGDFTCQISLAELIRGEEALQLLNNANSYGSSVTALDGCEFIIAKYITKLTATNESDPRLDIGSHYSHAVSGSGEMYDDLHYSIRYGNGSCALYEGGSGEFYGVYEVNIGDYPVVCFEMAKSKGWISLAPAQQPN